MEIIKKLIRKIRYKFGWYNLRYETSKWVKKNIGKEYIYETLDKYDKINKGISIGGLIETIIFLDVIEKAKFDFIRKRN